jgi:hypothetical protein
VSTDDREIDQRYAEQGTGRATTDEAGDTPLARLLALAEQRPLTEADFLAEQDRGRDRRG